MFDLTRLAGLSLVTLMSFAQIAPAQDVGLSAAAPEAENPEPFACEFRPSFAEVAFDVIPGNAGVFFRRDTDLEEFFTLTPESQRNFHDLAAALRIRGVDLVFMPLPPRGLVQFQYLNTADADQALYDHTFAYGEFKRFISQLKDADVTVVDLLAEIDADDLWDSFYYMRDHHWTTVGAHEAAVAVAAALQTLPNVAALSTYVFKTQETGSLNRKSPMGFEIQRRCGVEIPAEKDLSYATTRAAATADDLLGAGTQTPPIALVGSSFSASRDFHFQDFISQESSLELANYAIDGAEFIGSLASLVHSRTFIDAPPPVIIWEAPSYYNINLELFSSMPQLLPAIFGPCAEGETIATSGEVAVGDSTKILSFEPGDSVAGKDYYLFIDGADMGDTSVSVTLRYSDGEYFSAALGDFPSFVRDGRYYLQLSDELAGSLVEVSVDTTAPVHLTAKICTTPPAFAKIGIL